MRDFGQKITKNERSGKGQKDKSLETFCFVPQFAPRPQKAKAMLLGCFKGLNQHFFFKTTPK